LSVFLFKHRWNEKISNWLGNEIDYSGKSSNKAFFFSPRGLFAFFSWVMAALQVVGAGGSFLHASCRPMIFMIAFSRGEVPAEIGIYPSTGISKKSGPRILE
jgi:hypothetical protein